MAETGNTSLGGDFSVVLVHNSLTPYRIPLFNAINRALGGRFTVVMGEIVSRRRRWSIAIEDVEFDYEIVPTWNVGRGSTEVQVSARVGRTLDRLQPDVLVLAGWNLGACWSARAWSKRHAVPTVAWVESAARTGQLRGRVPDRVRSHFLRDCHAALVPGEDAAQYVTRLCPGIEVSTMPNSVNPIFCDHRDRTARPASALYVGELSERKGVDLLLEGAPELAACLGSVVIAGDGPLRSQVEAAARENPHVEYLGFRQSSDLLGLYAASSAVLVPSRRDPWPLVACEALSVGRPVVLGRGVGSATDLKSIGGAAVEVMESMSAEALVRAARHVARRRVPDAALGAFAPEVCASDFVSIATRVASATGMTHDKNPPPLKLKVAVDAIAAAPGGGRAYLGSQLPELERQGLQLRVYCREELAEYFEGALSAGDVCSVTSKTSIRRTLVSQFVLPFVARLSGCSVLYCPGSVGPVLSPLPYVICIQNPHLFGKNPPSDSRHVLLRAASWLSNLRAASIVHLSKTMAEAHREYSGLKVPSYVVYPGPGASTDANRESSGEARPYILMVSNLYEYKRTDVVVNAYLMTPTLTEHYDLLIAGRELQAGIVAPLEAAVRRAGHTNAVHFLGFVEAERLAALYAKAAAVVSASEREAFPLTPAEALRNRAPIVLSDIPVFRELYGRWALFARPGDPLDFGQKLRQAVQHCPLPESTSAAVEDQFSWHRNGHELARILKAAAVTGLPSPIEVWRRLRSGSPRGGLGRMTARRTLG